MNPGRRNAIPSGQWGRLAELFTEFEASEQRVLVLTGADGDFCSGADMGSDFVPGAVIDVYEMLDRVGAAALALRRCTKPTIAAVDGVAVGAGMNLALGCDMLIASERAIRRDLRAKGSRPRLRRNVAAASPDRPGSRQGVGTHRPRLRRRRGRTTRPE